MSNKTLVVAGIIVVVIVAAVAVAMMNTDGPKDVTEGVIYDGNGGTTSSGKSTMGLTSHEVFDNVFTKEGAHFESWNTKKDGSGTTYMPGDTIDYASGKTVTLYAIWDESKHLYVNSVYLISYFTLEYDGKELSVADSISLPESGEISITVKSNNGGQAVIVDSKIEFRSIDGDVVRSYTFTPKLSGHTGLTIVPGNGDALLKITYDGSEDVELSYNQGTMALSKGINYSGNGGKTSAGEGSFSEDSSKVAANMFTLEGKTFVGWNTSKDGTGTSYKAGDTIEYYGYAILYAQWA